MGSNHAANPKYLMAKNAAPAPNLPNMFSSAYGSLVQLLTNFVCTGEKSTSAASRIAADMKIITPAATRRRLALMFFICRWANFHSF
jgi:hypothetical protein